jgi:hypothetical protein
MHFWRLWLYSRVQLASKNVSWPKFLGNTCITGYQTEGFFTCSITQTVTQLLYNKTNQMHQFPKFTPAWNSTCFGQFLRPSSGVYSLYTQPSWSCSKAVFKLLWHITLPSEQWINSWWWVEELPDTCRVSCRSIFGKLVHLVGFITKKFVTIHGYMNLKNTDTYITVKPKLLHFIGIICVVFILNGRTWGRTRSPLYASI